MMCVRMESKDDKCKELELSRTLKMYKEDSYGFVATNPQGHVYTLFVVTPGVVSYDHNSPTHRGVDRCHLTIRSLRRDGYSKGIRGLYKYVYLRE